MWGRALLLVLVIAFTADGEGVQEAYDTQLKVGRSVDIFTRFGYLSLSMKVVPRNESDPNWIFREPSVDVFTDSNTLIIRPRLAEKNFAFEGDFHMEFCDNLRQLLQAYFRDFSFERMHRPWRAFTASWTQDTISKHLGINSSFVHGDHCYVLVRLSRFRDTAKLSRLPSNINISEMVEREIDNVRSGDVTSVLLFMRKYGSHFINSYVTGNSLYQLHHSSNNITIFLLVNMHSRRSCWKLEVHNETSDCINDVKQNSQITHRCGQNKQFLVEDNFMK
ncbi:hypothetical protein FQA39_LY10375 [Lamprigera yunnana]|nr:hypothetical protein FQA39_LY10375 [Lamprigera yunnana]